MIGLARGTIIMPSRTQQQWNILTGLCIGILLAILPFLFVHASSVRVENSVDVRAETGGNATSESVRTGDEYSRIYVENRMGETTSSDSTNEAVESTTSNSFATSSSVRTQYSTTTFKNSVTYQFRSVISPLITYVQSIILR